MTWPELFPNGYFDHDEENNKKKSKLEVHTFADIAVGFCKKSNAIIQSTYQGILQSSHLEVR
jgi:hypothetical protein